jgi:hypothetical protein
MTTFNPFDDSEQELQTPEFQFKCPVCGEQTADYGGPHDSLNCQNGCDISDYRDCPGCPDLYREPGSMCPGCLRIAE